MHVKIILMLAHKGKVDDAKYIINSRWWRQWMKYVNFEKNEN